MGNICSSDSKLKKDDDELVRTITTIQKVIIKFLFIHAIFS